MKEEGRLAMLTNGARTDSEAALVGSPAGHEAQSIRAEEMTASIATPT